MAAHITAEVPALRVLLAKATSLGDTHAAATALERLSWLAWISLDGDLAEECAREAQVLHVPEVSPEAFRLAVRRAVWELQQGNARSALETLDAAERAGERLDVDAFVSYLSVRADVLSALGEFEPATECARLSYSIAQKRPNAAARFITAVYLAYSYEAAGSFDASQATYDEAASIAERANMHWESAHAQARGAWIALHRGDGAGARRRLLKSLGASEQTPWLEVTRASAGITIGLALGDDRLIETFADESWIDRALASRDAYSIGRIVNAFYELFRARGDRGGAVRMCSIALDRCSSADCMWPMFAAVARDGDETDIERARARLDAFPQRHPIASAQRKLFEAVLADRKGNAARAAQRAGEAYVLLDALGLHYQATLALVLTGRVTQARAQYLAFGFVGLVRRLSASAARGRPRLSVEAAQHRREIFALLLEGCSTKEIAQSLGLSQRTVKSRISEIYQLTGAATRHDLAAGMSSLL